MNHTCCQQNTNIDVLFEDGMNSLWRDNGNTLNARLTMENGVPYPFVDRFLVIVFPASL